MNLEEEKFEPTLSKEEIKYAKSLGFKYNLTQDCDYLIKRYSIGSGKYIELVCERSVLNNKLSLSYWDTPLEYYRYRKIKSIKDLKIYDKKYAKIAELMKSL